VVSFADRLGANERQIGARLRLGEFMVPVQPPRSSSAGIAFSVASVPRRIKASTAPAVSIVTSEKERFADFHISTTGVRDELREPLAAVLGGRLQRVQPASTNCRYASLKPLGVVTCPGPISSPPCRRAC